VCCSVCNSGSQWFLESSPLAGHDQWVISGSHSLWYVHHSLISSNLGPSNVIPCLLGVHDSLRSWNIKDSQRLSISDWLSSWSVDDSLSSWNVDNSRRHVISDSLSLWCVDDSRHIQMMIREWLVLFVTWNLKLVKRNSLSPWQSTTKEWSTFYEFNESSTRHELSRVTDRVSPSVIYIARTQRVIYRSPIQWATSHLHIMNLASHWLRVSLSHLHFTNSTICISPTQWATNHHELNETLIARLMKSSTFHELNESSIHCQPNEPRVMNSVSHLQRVSLRQLHFTNSTSHLHFTKSTQHPCPTNTMNHELSTYHELYEPLTAYLLESSTFHELSGPHIINSTSHISSRTE